jgi:hypothetical protein
MFFTVHVAAALSPGSVEVTTFPSRSTATHSEDDGHETLAKDRFEV